MRSLNQRKMKSNWRDDRMAGPSGQYHIPNIPRPQDEFNIFVNNSNQPFEHVWLQRSEDGTRFIHPLENLSESDFIDMDIGSVEPTKPLPLENTPFKLVEEVKELKQLAAKLRSVNEFAIDLEHNQYRSFQGMTCLMQISTRTEDFVVDTLKLRVHVGPYLREIFKDPSKKKIMHGADKDILWLQRDFGIYLCNLFDTQQASRVLQLDKNSLEFIVLYFCGVALNKAYQSSDWRLRPLPDDMLKYAREDTHYLLYLYDLMRSRLFRGSNGGTDLLLEVYKRSYDLCMQLYEKELLTDTSYLRIINGVQEAGFSSQQLSIVAGLYEWRDAVARAEDESTGYILPKKTLLEIARQKPLTVHKLRQLMKTKHPYVDVNLDYLVDIVNSSIRNAAAFEPAAQLLKKRQQETVTGLNVGVSTMVSSQQERFEDRKVASKSNGQTTNDLGASLFSKKEYPNVERESIEFSRHSDGNFLQPYGRVREIKKIQEGHAQDFPNESFISRGQMRASYVDKENSDSAKALSGATEEALDRPSYDFGLRNAPLISKPNSKVAKQKGGVASFISSQREKSVADGDVDRENGQTTLSTPVHLKEEYPKLERENTECSRSSERRFFQPFSEVDEIKKEQTGHKPDLSKSFTILGQMRGPDKGNSDMAKAFSGAAKEVLNNPGLKSGLPNSTSKFETDSHDEVEQIKMMKVFPFQSFIPSNEQPKPQKTQIPQNSISVLTGVTGLGERSAEESYLEDQEALHNFLTADSNVFRDREDAEREQQGKEGVWIETTSLSNLSTKLWKCLQQLKHEKKNDSQIERAQEVDSSQLSSPAGMQQMSQEEESPATERNVGFKSLLNPRDNCNNSIICRFRIDKKTKGSSKLSSS